MPIEESQKPRPCWWRLPWDLLLAHFSEWARFRKPTTLLLLAVSLVSLILYLQDAELAARVSPEHRAGWVNELARGLSYWGDFLTFCIPVGVLFWLGGALLKRIPWQRAGVACLLGACLAGLTADLIQFSVGRARPRHDTEIQFAPFNTKTEQHSFPSGHSATAFGSATALAVCYPPVSVPLLLGASGVAWSRVYLGAHYPSDIVMGSGIGLVFGFLLGKTARKTRTTNEH
ncbi:MAG: phosphatase PAP2 family protein [Verrucomicrobiota bacterium]